MAVIRVNKTSDYTVMSNFHLREKEMSLKAKGLISLMLSLPDNWDYSIQGLCMLSKDGYQGVMSALKELEEYGYLSRTRATDDKGRFSGYDYDIFERPQSGFPITDKPSMDKPSTENPIQLNTYIPNTQELSTEEGTPITPTAEPKKNGRISELTKKQQILFDHFWEAYPRRVAKANAERAWKKVSPTEELTETIISAIKTAMKSDFRFREERFIPHPATFLNGREWENNYEATGGSTNGEFAPSTGVRREL